ncbi:DUF1624 domain-containing protein [Gallaecimonas xiamenensis]|uniref:Heparan-alpha-glucosaminide N-acetyltransferase catalytic domain-containing protein n=1 Tax=Gallaecimonas xiamenensis 3-C-1 TaxID=745411 RepID=K2JU69_9GAMM|nr:heparan-alpha-glucosaminide N-acetyltransferase domain-containing protein [Gallaecimonas xiamenensis]EKE73944.1 hypothetical protein B3C1_09003 [Gallaecimonas xiamenensis 3-C-1]
MPSETALNRRIGSIDMMRGLVMLLMLVDHVRERFYLHMQVTDPMTLDSTSPGLFLSRFAAHFCAPTFVFLTGLSAWLYSQKPGRSARSFLAKRGLFLIALELTLVTFSWMGSYQTLYLQVIWAIGLSMLALAALASLPRPWLLALGLVIVFGHNLLSPISLQPGDWGYSLWTVLHDRGYLISQGPLAVKVSYPVLPWIGVILLGYGAGPLYGRTLPAARRHQWLLALGLGCLVLFALLRGLNLYGESLPWQQGSNLGWTLMSLFNLTKYPPSLAFLLVTLGGMFLGLLAFERPLGRLGSWLSDFGAAPMFFYLLHLYVLLGLYSLAIALLGPNHGTLLGVDSIAWVWLISAALALYFPTRAFSAFKQRQPWPLLKYL